MFKFFFQEAPEKNSFLGITYDTIFTVLTTIIIFILGYVITKIIEAKKEKKRLKEIKEYFHKNLEILERPIERQRQSLIKFAKRLKEDMEQHFVAEDIVDFNLAQLSEISNKDLFTIFVLNKKGNISTKTELYGQLRASLYFFEAIRKNFKEDIKVFAKKLEEYTSTYRKNMLLLNDLLDKMISNNIRNQISPDQNPLLFEINKIRFNWIKSKDSESFRDMFVSFKEFIKPTQELIQKSQADLTIDIIVNPVMECVYSYHNIKELRYFYRKQFLIDSKNLQKKLFDLKIALKQFDEL